MADHVVLPRKFWSIADPRNQPGACISWCEANGLDAHQIPILPDGLGAPVRITDDKIYWREVSEDATEADPDTAPRLGPWRETQLKSPPAAHDLMVVEDVDG